MKLILKYLKPYKASAIGGILLTAVNNGLQLLLPALMALIVNNGITDRNLDYILKVGSYMMLASVIAVFVAILSSYCTSKAATGFGRELRRAIFVKAEHLSQCDIDKITASSMITRSTNDVRQVQEMVLITLKMMISAVIMMVGGTVMAFSLNKKLSLVLFGMLPVILFIAWIVARKIVPMYDIVQKRTDKLNQVLREKLSGIRVIRAFNRSDYEDGRFKEANSKLTLLMLKINRIYAALIPIAVMLLFGMIVLLVYLQSHEIAVLDAVADRQRIADTVGDLQAFVMYVLMIVFSVSMAASMYIFIPKAMICVNRIREVLQMEPQIQDAEETVQAGQKGIVRFEHVSFGYPNAEKYVLSDLNFETHPGEVTAIIGGTGSGKTTLVNLIPRFYDVSEGAIYIDGVDIRKLKQRSLHDKIGLVPQKSLLFSGTIADNLRFGKEDATPAEMEKALEIAQAKDFVDELPDKIYSMISQGGKNLSGGQKQRIAIARALIRQSELYIFDDSFSALDFKTDANLRKALKQELSHASILIVAQRIGTIIDADRIIVLDEGKIAAVGTHDQLSKTCGVYKEIMDSQFSGGEDMYA